MWNYGDDHRETLLLPIKAGLAPSHPRMPRLEAALSALFIILLSMPLDQTEK